MHIKIFSTVLIAFLLLIGCGGGDSSKKAQKRSYQVALSDDFLDGAIVEDSLKQIATYEGKGIYTFKKEPIGTITLKGGTFENTNIPNKMTIEIDASSKILSPIASFFYKYPHLKDRVLKALQAKEINYTINKNLALFRTSKIVYIMASNDLLDSFATSLKEAKNYNDIFQAARNTAKISPRATTIDAYLALITLSFFDVSKFSYIPGLTNNLELLVTSTFPKNNDTNIAKNALLYIQFNKSVKQDSKDKVTLKETLSGNNVKIDATVSRNFIHIDPDNDLKDNTKYTLSISSAIQSEDNKTLKNPQDVVFTTSDITDNTAPQVAQATGIETGTTTHTSLSVTGKTFKASGESIKVTFSEAVDPSSIVGKNLVYVKNTSGTTIAVQSSCAASNCTTSGSLDSTKKVYTIELKLNDGNYQLFVDKSIKDLAGNSMGSDYTQNFTVQATPTTPTPTPTPFSLTTSIANGATNIAIDHTITLNFSKTTTPLVGQITMQDITGGVTPTPQAIQLSPNFGNASQNFSLTPPPAFKYKKGHKYKLTISKDIEDGSGTKLSTTDITREFDIIPKTKIVKVWAKRGASFVELSTTGTNLISGPTNAEFRVEFSQAINTGSLSSQATINGTTLSVPITNAGTNTYEFTKNLPTAVTGPATLTIPNTVQDTDTQNIESTLSYTFTY